MKPTTVPTSSPSIVPSTVPSATPSVVPSVVPSVTPSEVPSVVPSVVPSEVPSSTPSVVPSSRPIVSYLNDKGGLTCYDVKVTQDFKTTDSSAIDIVNNMVVLTETVTTTVVTKTMCTSNKVVAEITGCASEVF